MANNERAPLLPRQQRTTSSSAPRSRLSETISVDAAWTALSLQCFISGFANTISFTCTKTWIGFMTGNLVQIALSIVIYSHITLLRAIRSDDDRGLVGSVFSQTDQQQMEDAMQRLLYSGIAIACFGLGAYLSSHLSSSPRIITRYLHWTATTRGRLVVLPLLYSALTLLLSIFLLTPGATPIPHCLLLTFLSFQAGSQASSALSLGGTPYSTTVVFTNPFTQVMSSNEFPGIFLPSSDSSTASSKSKTRQQAWSILLLVLGAIVAAVIIDVHPQGQAREGGTNDVGVLEWALLTLGALQLILAAMWAFVVPAEEKTDRED